MASKEVEFFRISNWKITMKQFSKILAAFNHWDTIVLSDIKIVDPDSTLRILPSLPYKVCNLHITSGWEASLSEKVLKALSQNKSLIKYWIIDIIDGNRVEGKEVMDLVKVVKSIVSKLKSFCKS